MVTENLRVVKSAREITYQHVGQRCGVCRGARLCSAHRPTAVQMFNRNAIDNMRSDWQAPRSGCTEGFDRTVTAAGDTLTRSAGQSSAAGELVGMGWTASEARFPGSFDDRHSYRQGCGGAQLCQRAQRRNVYRVVDPQQSVWLTTSEGSP